MNAHKVGMHVQRIHRAVRIVIRHIHDILAIVGHAVRNGRQIVKSAGIKLHPAFRQRVTVNNPADIFRRITRGKCRSEVCSLRFKAAIGKAYPIARICAG